MKKFTKIFMIAMLIGLLVKHGLIETLAVIATLLIIGSLMVLILWLLGFIMLCITYGIGDAWKDWNPVVLVKCLKDVD